MPQYTFKDIGNGKVDILEKGVSIAPGGSGYSVEYAQSLGYKPPAAPTAPQLSPIQNPVPANTLTPPQDVQLPQPTAPTVQRDYFTGATAAVESARTTLESEFTRQKEEADKKLADLRAEEKAIFGKQEALTQPFREQLENTERERLYINENFQANQRLVGELEALVTEGSSRLTEEAGRFAPRSAIQAGYNKTLTDITARAGLIQSVMSARNGQIGQAYTMIDRSVAAIAADRNDQLAYYDALLSLNEKGQIKLDTESKAIAEEQRTLLKGDLQRAEKTADTIKEAMIDPDTALAYAEAGVTLLDTPEEINKKLGKYAYAKEVRDISNEMALKGYAPVVPGANPPSGAQVVTVTDSKGGKKQYYAKHGAIGSGSSNTITDNERALLGQFQQSSIVKDYNQIVSQKLAIDNIIANGVGGPRDLSLVFSFMKGLDPNSVVRESEYETAAKSGNIFAGAFAKFNGYLKPEGGFLPTSVRAQFQNLVNQRLNAQQVTYDNYAKQYREIAARQGLNPDNVVPNFSGALDMAAEVPSDDQLAAEFENFQGSSAQPNGFGDRLRIFLFGK